MQKICLDSVIYIWDVSLHRTVARQLPPWLGGAGISALPARWGTEENRAKYVAVVQVGTLNSFSCGGVGCESGSVGFVVYRFNGISFLRCAMCGSQEMGQSQLHKNTCSPDFRQVLSSAQFREWVAVFVKKALNAEQLVSFLLKLIDCIPQVWQIIGNYGIVICLVEDFSLWNHWLLLKWFLWVLLFIYLI